LFADKDHDRIGGALTEHRLRGATIQITSSAAFRCLSGVEKRRLRWDEWRRRLGRNVA
jgi:hypothetical protein